MSLTDLLAAVRAAPAGPTTIAFFDYDGTVIDGYSAGAFYRQRMVNAEIGPGELVRTLHAGWRGIRTAQDFDEFLALSLQAWTGRPVAELKELGQRLFTREIAGRLRPEVWQLAQAHRQCGHQVVIASSATRFQVEPMAQALEADAVLCTELEAVGGVLTGRTAGPAVWGEQKALSVFSHAELAGVDPAACFGYANGSEDAPFLRALGTAVAVSPTDALRTAAAAAGWPVLDCAPRPGLLPGVGDLLRTAGFYGGMLAGIGAGIGVGLLRGSRRQLVDITCEVGADIGFGLAGVDVAVAGAEHLVAARPCVFVFNHQSGFDIPLMMKLLRGGFTGVAKKEAADIPMWGQLFRLAEVAFVDRGNTAQAKEALEPAIRRLRDDRMSLAIAPEGTRSPTPRLGPFKKGAFHIAIQAGVPMVPIVIRNAGEIMWRGAQTIRAGTVDVRVLPPVDTSQWRVESLNAHVEEVREMFVATLGQWPECTP